MHRFSAHNALGWIAGVAGLVALFGFQVGFFDGTLGLVVFLCALVVGGWWVYQQWDHMRHSERLQRFAATNGWTFQEAGPLSVAQASGFPFGMGIQRRVEDYVEGTYAGVPCASYTYLFEHHADGERGVVQTFTVTQTRLPVPLPRLDLLPEDAGTKLLSVFAGGDINFESAEFNRKWRVQSADRKFAIDVVDPRMMELLLRHHLPGLAVRIDGYTVLVWSAGRASVGDLSRRLDIVTGVARRIPQHVIRIREEAETQRRADEAAREAAAPTWANTGGVLNSGTYTGIGVDSDGDGVEDWEQRNR
jgi:hypothetical protein